MLKKKALIGVTALAMAAGLGLAACSGSSGSGSSAAPSDGSVEFYGHKVTLDQSLADQLPQAMKDKGTLATMTNAAAPPRVSIDENGNIVGAIPDLVKAVGAKLGLDVTIETGSFDGEVPGVQSGKYDMTFDTGDFPSRREVVDLVDYMQAGYVYLVSGGNPKNVTNDPLSQCGLTVGVTKGTTQETLVTALNQQCIDAGKPAIDLQSFGGNVLLEVPLQAGRADVVWESTSTGFKVAADDPKTFEVAGDPIFSAYLGFGVLPTNSQFRDVLQKALQELQDDGTYQAILDNWDQGQLAMDYISVNSDVRS